MPATLDRLEIPTTAPVAPQAAARLASLDAFRGFIMITLAADGFGWRRLAEHPTFSGIAAQFQHVPWTGMAFWDLIQPAFLFMVGMSMPLSFARRRAEGAGFAEILRHVAFRSVMLILLSQVLMSISANRLYFQLINVLSQIAFTYFLAFLILQLRFPMQALAAAALLGGHWALFALFPGSEGPFSKADNIGCILDRACGLNYSGYYVTINFISSTVTTLFGAWSGLLLRRDDSHARRLKIFAAAAAACFLAGWALTPLNPMIKRLWTASFTLFSAGWVFLMLMAFYWLVEMRGYRRVAFPLIVVGMNSIFIYSLSIILAGWLDRSVAVFTSRFQFIGALAPVAQAATVVLVMWYLCYWLYRRRIFFKI